MFLELGCGNGWLAHNLATSLNAEVCAVDVNETELLQGARVFNGQKNLCFVYANIFSFIFNPKKFDTIILGSSIQYFHDLKNLFATLFDLMNPGGTIYIADSPFYTTQEKADAAKKEVTNTSTHWAFQKWQRSTFTTPLANWKISIAQ